MLFWSGVVIACVTGTCGFVGGLPESTISWAAL